MPARRKQPKRTDAEVERARVELIKSGGVVAEAARAAGVPRTTVSEWIRTGKFNPDEWDAVRDQRRLTAIERAWDGLLKQIAAAQEIPHNVFSTKDGDVVIGPPNPHASAQIADMLSKTLERLAGIGVAPSGEGGDAKPASGEVIYRLIVERREGRTGT